VAILCYEITGSSQPNARSTTGAEDGHIGAVLKGVIVSFQQIDTVAAGQAVASPMRRLGM